MYVILPKDQQTRPEMFPDWCGLSTFHHFRDIDKDVEPHYHDAAAEVWVWGDGSAQGAVDGRTVPLRYGVVIYTPAFRVHGYVRDTRHSNTGIQPRWQTGAENNNHRKVREVGPPTKPAPPPAVLAPDDNPIDAPATFPDEAFLAHAACGRFDRGADIVNVRRPQWWGLLVREGRVGGAVDNEPVDLTADDALVVSADTPVILSAPEPAECVIAVGRSAVTD